MQEQWLRLVLAISLDGRLAFPDGSKKNLAGLEDRKELEKALAWADATLIGGKTLRVHKTTCIIHDRLLINQRLKDGRTKQPISLVVSKSRRFPNDLTFFAQPIEKWLISPFVKNEENKELKRYDNQIVFEKNWEKTIKKLNKAGLYKLLILGGAELVKSFLLEDIIDELQLTITPRIIGGPYNWSSIFNDQMPINLSKNNSWKLKENKILDDHEVLIRYMRNRLTN